ncbi:glycoside hydrolase family 32 protein [Amniculicola lignicola CBS 123094]|uniref:Glycoside hydrolase family 32 protein n=1 Tax=Amniculicola lignicola CBS 123094 TaxID=1392246 RepID=A0A6A5WSM7_9PLEO|nr:glycoside hydrolase family 32 protein [Amniculicola lignicola CBS 123094]
MYFESFPDPNRTSHGVSWGHVTSSDLYTWSMQPIALQSDTYDIGSGSIVLDKNNTSGLFPNQTDGVIAILTKQHRGTGGQVQAIMSSNDGGYTFIENPKAPRIPGSEGSENFRDPKVIWHEPNQRWVMTASKAASTAVGIYTSPNLIDWVLASEFNNKHLLDAGYEVEHPNLVPIPRLNSTGARNKNHPTVPGGTVKDFGDYVLVGSSREGSPLNGGSVTRYFPGKFNGTHFEPTNNRTDQFIDFGPDNYATQFFFGLPHGAPVVGLGLASNLHYTKSPTSHGISRTTTFTGPREGYLIHDPGEGELSFFTRPFNLDAFREEILANYSAQHLLEHNVVFNGSDAVLVETRFEMLPPDDEMVELNVDFIFRSLISAEQIFCTIVFNTWAADFGCDRSEAFSKWLVGSSRLNQMSARQVRPLLPFHNPAVRRWEVQAFMDRSILEVFLNDGVKAGTTTIFSESPIDSIRFQSSKIPTWATLGVTVQRLRSKEVHYGIAHDSLSSPIDALQEKKDLEHIKVYQYVVAASLFARESICGAISDVLQMLASGSVPTKTRGCPLTYE